MVAKGTDLMAEHIKMTPQEAKAKVAQLRQIVLGTYAKEIKNHSEEHGGANQMILQKALEDGYGNERAGWSLEYCARISVEMMANFYDGVYRRCNP
jgi:hypothetical protein